MEHLRQRRVFSVYDLQRVSSTRAGREALSQVIPVDRLEQALTQSQLLSFGPLPPRVAEEMVRAKVTSPDALVEQDPKKLAKTLSTRLWQGRMRDLTRLDLPSTTPAVPVVTPTLDPVVVERPREAATENGRR